MEGREEEWERCMEWMGRERVVAADNKILWSRTAAEFSDGLKDGVVLCLLLNRLKPGVLESKEFSQHPKESQVGGW